MGDLSLHEQMLNWLSYTGSEENFLNFKSDVYGGS